MGATVIILPQQDIETASVKTGDRWFLSMGVGKGGRRGLSPCILKFDIFPVTS